MNTYLLSLAIGPVQEFIAAARRTRDLWFGSNLLSELSKAAAAEVVEKHGRLIFPFLDANDLKPDSDVNAANIILAKIDGSPEDIADKAGDAVQMRWKEFVDEAYAVAKDFVDDSLWQEQWDDVLEFYAAWVPLPDESDYPQARCRVTRLLAARKQCRYFSQAPAHPGIPKSSLDGARESVWRDPGADNDRQQARQARRLRLAEGEQLDVVGLVKRQGGGKKSYPSVSRIAADPWLRRLHKENRNELKLLANEAEKYVSKGLVKIDTNRWSQYANFPYEGVAVYRNRYHELAEESGCKSTDYNSLANEVKKLENEFGEPDPYLAIIAADGDRMGATIARLEKVEDHQKFSSDLSKFAIKARVKVADHFGCPVYTGGDDVLALVPLDRCLDCAKDLHKVFADTLNQWKDEEGNSPTLSVGIAIGHFMEPLEDLLEWARAAEKDAKDPDRNGLAVHLYTRSGAPVHIRKHWDTDPVKCLKDWMNLFVGGQLPSRFPYNLRELVLNYSDWPEDTDANSKLKHNAVRHELARLIRKKRPANATKIDMDVLAPLLLGYFPDSPGEPERNIKRLQEDCVIAQRIARAASQLLNPPGGDA